MPAPTTLRCLLFLAWLTSSVAAEDASTSANELTIPGLPQQAPQPSVVDTVNLFRNHQEERTQLDDQLTKLAAENGVDLWLVTVSFQTKQSPAQEAAEIVAAWSGDRPAIVLVYIRGNHGTGIAANSSLQEIVPSFELAGALPASENASSPPDADSAPDTQARVTSLVETTRKIADLVERYSTGDSPAVNRERADTNTGPATSPASARRAESLLLLAVLAIAALIVWFMARAARR